MQLIKLVDLCDVFADGDWIESKDQSIAGIRLIQTGNVGLGSFKNKLDKARYVSEDTFKRLNCTEILPGDLLVSRLPDPVGRACIVPSSNTRMITAVDCTIIRPKHDIVTVKYLLHHMMSSKYLRSVDRLCTGTTRKRISRKALGEILVPVPSLPEQQRIVTKLDVAFEKINNAIKLTRRNIDYSQLLFRQQLKNTFQNQEYKSRAILDICELKSGNTIAKSLERPEGDLLYVKVGDMNYPGNEKYITGSSRFASSKDIKSGQIIPQGSIIFPKRGGAIATNKKRIITKPTIIDLNTMALIPKNGLSSKLLYYWFLQYDLRSLSNGTSIPQINNYSFKNTYISVPENADEQEALSARLHDLHERVELLDKLLNLKLERLHSLKQSLLSQTFSEKVM